METPILKFWYMACTIFCLYSLRTVILEHYEVTILPENRNETDATLICKELSSFQLNKSEIRLKDLRGELVNHFNKIPVLNPSQLLSKNSALNRLKTGHYVIFNDLLCIILKDKSEGFGMNEILSQLVYFVFRNNTLDFAQMASWWESFDQLLVQKKGPPYSNCSEGNERFRCLNECFKKNFRLSRYFYEGNETGLIHLKPATYQTIEREKSCLEKCERENCEIVQFIPFSESRVSRTTTLGANPKLSKFDFIIQFIGLVCSFANISLNQFASMAIKFASSKVKRRKVRIGLFCLKWAILFLTLTYCGYLYISMTLDYKAEERNPTRKEITRNLIKQKTFRLAICVKIDIDPLKKTMSELEKATDDALDDYLKGIYMNYQGRMFKVDYSHEPKVLFKKFVGLWGVGIISRCFSLYIYPNYHLMPSSPKLTLKFKQPTYNYKLYLQTENESLSGKTFEYTSKAFVKRIVRRLKRRGRCVNYRERDVNCTEKMNCIERCTNREAFEEFKKIPIDMAVVDKNQFSQTEWGMTHPVKFAAYGPNLNRSIYLNISARCFKKFQDDPCVEVKFDENVEIILQDPQTKEIDLLLDVELSVEEFTWFKLLLNIMNIQSIFFGITVLKLLRMLYSFFKPNLRIRNDKIALSLIYLLCFVGFTWHTYCIFELSINGELNYSPNYEIVKQVRMPVMVFCQPIHEKLIDKNHQLTGNYLEQQTSEMTPESLFESITYLNESSEWTPFSIMEQFFFLHLKCNKVTIDQGFDRRQFHFSTNSQILKVLRVNFTKNFLKQGRKKEPVFFMTKTKETGFSNVANLVYDLSSTRYSAEQSELAVKYEDRFSFIKRFLSTSYEDEFNDLEGQLPELKTALLHRNGLRFKTLKIPLKKHDFDFELRDDLFNQLYIQINTETSRNWLDSLDYQQTLVLNHLKKVNHKNYDYNYDSGFTFSLTLIKKTLSAKNEENFAKLVLNLLNVLFLWFDLGILDLHPIFILTHDYLLVYLYLHWPVYLFNKITQFLLFCHRWLKKFEPSLYKRLDSRQRNPRRLPRV